MVHCGGHEKQAGLEQDKHSVVLATAPPEKQVPHVLSGLVVSIFRSGPTLLV